MARLRRFVASLILLGVVGFAGGVWYSRINDTFHDIFTEFVPFGEQAVLYLEELEFQKKKIWGAMILKDLIEKKILMKTHSFAPKKKARQKFQRGRNLAMPLKLIK